MSNARIIIGIDEVGRGCVFGPLVVAAVANVKAWTDPDVKDSKAFKSEARRAAVSSRIASNTLWSLATVESHAIDEQGMVVALEGAFVQALDGLIVRTRKYAPGRPIHIVMDGHEMTNVSQRYRGGDVTVEAMPRADAIVFEVGAASIIAKVSRDQWCRDIVQQYPTLAVYDIAVNKGYGVANHTAALFKHGMTAWHRKAFCETLLRNAAEKARVRAKGKVQ